MALYGKDSILSLVGSMIKSDRLSHSFIIMGEKGQGRLTVAKEMARMILCKGENAPCGACKSCVMSAIDAHPDMITLVPSGKQENFRSDDLRFLISDATLSANEGGYKVYILPEIDKALPVAQNVLLKIIEEPPAKVVFIMTATSKEKILPTVRSRAVSLSLPVMSEDDCVAILCEKGYSSEQAHSAVARMGTNVGRCIDSLEGSSDNSAFEAASKILDGMISADEYILARELSFFESDRVSAVYTLGILQSAVRDAIAAKKGGIELYSPFKDKALELSRSVRSRGLEMMYTAMGQTQIKIQGSGNMSLTLADLACKLKTYSLM